MKRSRVAHTLQCRVVVAHDRHTRGNDVLLRMGSSQLGIEADDHHDEEWTTERFRPHVLLSHLGRLDVALDERVGKGCAQKMAPLRRDNDQAPGVSNP